MAAEGGAALASWRVSCGVRFLGGGEGVVSEGLLGARFLGGGEGGLCSVTSSLLWLAGGSPVGRGSWGRWGGLCSVTSASLRLQPRGCSSGGAAAATLPHVTQRRDTFSQWCLRSLQIYFVRGWFVGCWSIHRTDITAMSFVKF